MGALLAVPLMMAIKEVFLGGYEDTHWLSDVIASEGADAGDTNGEGAISEAMT